MSECIHVPGYEVGREIGKGSFATVYIGQRANGQGIYSRTSLTGTKTDQSVAIKAVLRSKLTKKLLENLESEISILKAIRHPHIVSLLDKTESESHIHLIMEYLSMCDLSVLIKRRDKDTHDNVHIRNLLTRFPSVRGAGLHEILVRHFLQQLASALQFLRCHNLMHRDVKPQNLLLHPACDSSHQERTGASTLPVLKLADFGFARYLHAASLAETLCGSPLYMAPEILRYEKYDATADLWSTGTVLYEMLVGRPPFRAANHVELLRKIDRAEDVIRFPEEPLLDSEIKDLCRRLLKRQPRERISFEQFFADRVITKPIELIDSTTDTGESLIPPPHAAKSPSKPRGTVPNPQLCIDSMTQLSGQVRCPGQDAEYVVVEKKAVELNTLADNMARPPASRYQPIRTPSHALHQAVMPHAAASVERRPESSRTSALARAISAAGQRLFGSCSPPAWADSVERSRASYGRSLDCGDVASILRQPLARDATRQEKALIEHIGRLAMRASAVYDFAEIKLAQLSGPMLDDAIEKPLQQTELTTDAVIDVCHEAVVLYLKSLQVLHSVVDVVQDYVSQENPMPVGFEVNALVQWTREKYNEILDKAETLQQRRDALVARASLLCKEITVERLLFDRALDLCRAAAVNEMTGDDLIQCEDDYEISILMLEAAAMSTPTRRGSIEQDAQPEDDEIIIKWTNMVRQRLEKLKLKLETNAVSHGSTIVANPSQARAALGATAKESTHSETTPGISDSVTKLCPASSGAIAI
ncbi:Serine/threonine-protein kinase [Savitreella phatthalungensis]